MILHREGEVRPCDLPVRLFELLECVRRVKLMQNMAVDVDQLAAVHAARHQMRVPNLVEQGLCHAISSGTRSWDCRCETRRGIAHFTASAGNFSLARIDAIVPSAVSEAMA